MSASEIIAIGAAVLAALLAGVFIAACYLLLRSARDLDRALATFVEDTDALLAEIEEASRHAAAQVDRVDRLVTAAEGIEDRVEGAGRLARRTFQSPVVKAMAFGAGVSRASDRLRSGTDLSQQRKRRRRRKAS